MAVVPQISNPFQSKGYQSSLNNQNRPGGEQFEIIQLTRPQLAPDIANQRGRQPDTEQLTHSRPDLPQMMVRTPKDPTMAVETLKQLISSDLLATAAANGYTELYGELEGLSKSIYLAVDNLVAEMLNQEAQTTMFSGSTLFDLLREVTVQAQADGNGDTALAIANFLKAVNFSFNRDEILNALSANLRFLSTYFSPSPPLSEKLATLADAWAGNQARENFEILKGETIRLLYNVSDSLLNNEKTQILIPLIIHNLSRYNTNDYMVKEAFSNLLTHIPHSHKGMFMAAFDEFLNAMIYGKADAAPADSKPPADSGAAAAQAENVSGEEARPSTLDKDSFPYLYEQKLSGGGIFPPFGMTRDTLADGLRGFLLGKLSGMDAVTSILMNLIEGRADADLLTALQADLAKQDSITSLVTYLNDILKQLPDVPERQMLFEMLSETISGMAEKGELPPESPKQVLDFLNEGESATVANTANQAAQTQSGLPQLHQSGVPEGAPGAEIPEGAEGAVAPGNAETAAEQAQPAKSSIEELTAFIEKNINHNALKTLDSYNASNLLQSLINAPGVYTPLSHFIIPLQIGDARAFGELWVDNDDKSGGGNGGDRDSENNYHLFLTFEIEAVGRFETDLYAHGNQVSLAVLHPLGFSGEIDALKEKINHIIASTDYSVQEFQTGVLREPHDLTQIFPRITEKRQGLDISV